MQKQSLVELPLCSALSVSSQQQVDRGEPTESKHILMARRNGKLATYTTIFSIDRIVGGLFIESVRFISVGSLFKQAAVLTSILYFLAESDLFAKC